MHYLKPVGGKFILCCDFDVKKLPVKLPVFYEECLEYFAECSAARQDIANNLTGGDFSKIVLWNNKAICINGKSVYNHRLAVKGILRLGDRLSLLLGDSRYIGKKLSECTRKNDEFNSLAKMTNSINCTKFRNN